MEREGLSGEAVSKQNVQNLAELTFDFNTLIFTGQGHSLNVRFINVTKQ